MQSGIKIIKHLHNQKRVASNEQPHNMYSVSDEWWMIYDFDQYPMTFWCCVYWKKHLIFAFKIPFTVNLTIDQKFYNWTNFIPYLVWLCFIFRWTYRFWSACELNHTLNFCYENDQVILSIYIVSIWFMISIVLCLWMLYFYFIESLSI